MELFSISHDRLFLCAVQWNDVSMKIRVLKINSLKHEDRETTLSKKGKTRKFKSCQIGQLRRLSESSEGHCSTRIHSTNTNNKTSS